MAAKQASKKSKKKKNVVPYHYRPTDMDFEKWQLELRRQYAHEQKFGMKRTGAHPFYSDFELFNPASSGTYKVSIRSKEPGENFCNCMDFRVNGLGTCKHIEYVLYRLSKNSEAKKASNIIPARPYSSLTLKYRTERKIMLRIGTTNAAKMRELAANFFDRDYSLTEHGLLNIEVFLKAAASMDAGFKCYPDAMEFIIEQRERNKREKIFDAGYKVSKTPDDFNEAMKVKLFPYQQEGVLKAAKAGRFIIADDMGLGKTIQAIAVAELMKRELKIERVLIICPTSLKYQWQSEIKKFVGSESLVISGLPHERSRQLKQDDFYKIISYNAAIRNTDEINAANFDLIILDEAQRIKNWQTLTARKIKRLESDYCLVLTGTPLENKLDELHSIVEFVNPYQLGLLSRFLFEHQILDDHGRIKGYKDLNSISKTLQQICIRRTKKEVLKQLPSRTDKNYFVETTPKQKEIHDGHLSDVSQLVAKWKRMKFLSEKDRRRLLLSLSCMRMLADSTYILDQTSRHDTKIDELMDLVDDILQQPDEKVVVFTQWQLMGTLVAQELEAKNIKYEFLHGGVPADKRGALLDSFRNNPDTKIFLSTDAGGTGLNLQSASYLVNLDVPWNPAVLEQRIGRIYRLGQQKPVQIFNFVSKNTIEERLLDVLQFKKNLFEGVLDGGDDVVFMGESKLKQLMNSVEEITNINKAGTPETEEAGIPHQPSDIPPAAETAETINEQIINHEETESLSRKQEQPENKQVEQKSLPQGSANDFIQQGVSFFSQLSDIMADKSKQEALVKELVHENEETGETYVKLKVANKESVQNFFQLVGGFIAGLQKK